MTPISLMSAILIHAQMNGIEAVSAIDRGVFVSDVVVLIRGTQAQAEALECDLRAVVPVTLRLRVVVDELARQKAVPLPISPASYYSAKYPRHGGVFREAIEAKWEERR